MKTMQEWLDEYALSHTHPINKKIHYYCVPIIMFSILALAYSIQPIIFIGLVLFSGGFYLFLNVRIALTMLVIVLFFLVLLLFVPKVFTIWSASIAFVIAWIFQFIGHKIEGKKPAFFKDIQFLLIGPIWILNAIPILYRQK